MEYEHNEDYQVIINQITENSSLTVTILTVKAPGLQILIHRPA